MIDLSKAKEKLFGKAFARNKDRDLITDIYDKSGEMFRDSFLGKLSKKAITSDFTKTQRDKILDKFGAPEHYKRFAQYLTGGTVGNKDVTTLPEKIRKDVVRSHLMGSDKDPLIQAGMDELDVLQGYPQKQKTILSPKFSQMLEAAKKEKELTGDDSSYAALQYEDAGMIPNPNYDPDSTLLSTYATSKPTRYSLGHVQFKPEEDGGFRMTDTYKVDPNESFGHDTYKPLRGYQSDLREGGRLAARLYDLSKFFGVNQPIKYNVRFGADEASSYPSRSKFIRD
tara:strand:+ start:229 stop:1077 length:849 start_codon:yes stop_codon:yes gene_type:complete